MDIRIWEQKLSVCKLSAAPSIDFNETLLFFANTGKEISLVCQTNRVPKNVQKCEDGWRALEVVGPLDFALTGVLSRLAGVLAEANIPIFAVSTFDTDYILVKEEKLQDAIGALIKSGYRFV